MLEEVNNPIISPGWTLPATDAESKGSMAVFCPGGPDARGEAAAERSPPPKPPTAGFVSASAGFVIAGSKFC